MMNILFLCTGNSARSIIAEALTNRLGQGRLRAFSAGSMPRGEVNPHALPIVRALGFKDEEFRSKPWEEFAAPGAPTLDVVITVCDNAAGEVCPVWPGQPVTAHWGVPDPAAVLGTEAAIAVAFGEAARMLRNRITLLLALPVESLDRLSLQTRTRDIGATADLPETAG
jgi:arsenate reductase